MKLVFREYLASLRERRELDAVLPDLLSEIGYTVLSRPSIGTRQYGVDVTALGPKEEDGNQRLYLFSIKQGDLTRTDWDGNPQALRSSLNEILDVFIPTRISTADRGRDIVICICFGGEIQESVRDNVIAYTNANTARKISFQIWNGDHMAGLLVEGILREQLVEKALRTHFQKALAMLDQPDSAITHFSALMDALLAGAADTPQQRTAALRRIYICLWVLFVWARDADNLEAPFRLSERALIKGWKFGHNDVGNSTRANESVRVILADLADLHFRIWDTLIGQKILPHVTARHAISAAVPSGTDVDINLSLFRLLGRISARGLWHLWSRSGRDRLPTVRSNWNVPEASFLAKAVMELIWNNPLLLNPATNSQVSEIGTCLLFLSMMKEWQPAARDYLSAMIPRIVLAYKTYRMYPIASNDYRSLINFHSDRSAATREAQTKASSLIPLLALWASSTGASEVATKLADFASNSLEHCAMQTWLAGKDTEDQLYGDDNQHGLSLMDLPVTASGDEALKILEDECSSKEAFDTLSAIRLDHWPIVVYACRYQNLPLPPQLWLDVVRQMRDGQGQVPKVHRRKKSKKV